MGRTKVAILSTFPAWKVDESIPASRAHYAVWLLPLYERFGQQDQWEIHWICSASSVAEPRYIQRNNQHFHILPQKSLTVGLFTAYIRERLSVNKILKEIQPDIVHSWGTEYFYGLCGMDYKGAIWVHTVQGLLKAYMKRGEMSWFHKVHSIYEPGVLRSARHLTTESEWAADCVRETAPEARPLIWDYAVEDRFFTTKRNLSDDPTCLYCGSSAEIKNLDTLIRVFSAPELSHVKLILAGPEHKESFPPNIVGLGRQPREKVAELLAETWCLVHPSKADTGPTTLKEARVMGVPVIATTSCGAKRYIEEGKSGYIVSPNDEQAYIRAILKITVDKATVLEFGRHKQAETRNLLSAETMYNGLIDIYSNLLASTRN